MNLTPAEVAEHLPPIAVATLQALAAEPEHQTEVRTRVCRHHPYSQNGVSQVLTWLWLMGLAEHHGQRRFSVTPAGEEMQDLCYARHPQAESAP